MMKMVFDDLMEKLVDDSGLEFSKAYKVAIQDDDGSMIDANRVYYGIDWIFTKPQVNSLVKRVVKDYPNNHIYVKSRYISKWLKDEEIQ